MTGSRPFQLAWLGIGMMLGAGTQIAFSVDKPAKENPNVVVLRSEKRVTLEKEHMTLKEMAKAFSEQTPYDVTLDQEIAQDDTPYHFLLRNTPFTRALNAVGYLAHGKWERTKAGYHLRPLTAAERATDTTQYEGALQRAAGSLSRIDPNDPSLSKDQHQAIQGFLDEVQRRQTDLAPFALDAMRDWQVTRYDHGLGVSYFVGPDQSSNGTGYWRSESWSWQQQSAPPQPPGSSPSAS